MISSKWNLRQCGILQLHKLTVTTTHFGFTTAHFGTATRLYFPLQIMHVCVKFQRP